MPNIGRSIAPDDRCLAGVRTRRSELAGRGRSPSEMSRAGPRPRSARCPLRNHSGGRGRPARRAGRSRDRSSRAPCRAAACRGRGTFGRSPSAARIARIHSGSAACAPSPCAPSFVVGSSKPIHTRGERAAGEADEPRVGVVVRRAGLAGGGPAERRGRRWRCRARRPRPSCPASWNAIALVEQRAAVGADALRGIGAGESRRTDRSGARRSSHGSSGTAASNSTSSPRRIRTASRGAIAQPRRAMIAYTRASSIGFTHDAPSAIGRTLGERRS